MKETAKQLRAKLKKEIQGKGNNKIVRKLKEQIEEIEKK